MRHLFFVVLLAAIADNASAQLVLPYSGIDPTATLSSFQITKSGTGGRANTLYITNASNTSDVLLVNTVGLGKAAYFSITNSGNTQIAVRGDSNGSGIGVFGFMTGTGRAGVFRITNASNTNYALHALTDGSGPALKVQAGTGYSGDFTGKVNIASSGTGAEILRLSTERPWVFRQTYTGPSTGLELYSTVGLKTFEITASGGTKVVTFFADDASPRVGFGTTTPTARVDSVAYSVPAIKGTSPVDTGESTGVMGVSGSPVGDGVYGIANSPSSGYGVHGKATGPSGLGVVGEGNGYGVYGSAPGAGYAVYANGRLVVSGPKSFRIDHPFNPENEYLFHYSTEMPEPQNAYNGSVTTDADGEAWVQLPDYFGAINKDFEYQLTVVDDTDSAQFVMAKVAREIRENKFKIRTSQPRIKVSWEVKAKRNDLYIRKYGAPVEVRKNEIERGTYQHPELYGKPKELGLGYRPSPGEQLRTKSRR